MDSDTLAVSSLQPLLAQADRLRSEPAARVTVAQLAHSLQSPAIIIQLWFGMPKKVHWDPNHYVPDLEIKIPNEVLEDLAIKNSMYVPIYLFTP